MVKRVKIIDKIKDFLFDELHVVVIEDVKDVEFNRYDWIDNLSKGQIITYRKACPWKSTGKLTAINEYPNTSHSIYNEDGTYRSEKLADAYRGYMNKVHDDEKMEDRKQLIESILKG